MIDHIEMVLLSFAHHIPLELFVLVGSLVEELLAPIPSPGILLLAGSLASLREYTIPQILFLSLCGSVGKSIGALGVYGIATVAENFFTGTLARIFPLSHAEIEQFGKRFTGTGRDYVTLTILRALPFIPSVVISGGSGLLRIPLRLFVVSTFLGTLVRDGIFLFVGYSGVGIVQHYAQGVTNLETLLEVIILVLVVAGLGYLYFVRHKNHTL